MALTRFQKKFIRKNIHRYPLAKIAAELGLTEQEVLDFLKTYWGEEKYQKFLIKSQHPRGGGAPASPGRHLGGEWLKTNWKILALLALLIFVVYFNSLGNAFVSDDIRTISENPQINKAEFFWKSPYLTLNFRNLVLFLTNKVFGLNPLFFRLENIIFHLASTWFFYFLATFFLSPPIPLLAAGFFAVHPLLTEAVSWISGGPYPIATSFFLLAFIFYIFTEKKLSGAALLALLFFWIAVSINSSFIVFPFILFIFELSQRKLLDNLVKIVPFFVVSGIWILQILIMLRSRVATLTTTFYHQPTLTNPLIQIPISISSYLELLFWPKDLAFYHSELSFTQFEYFLKVIVFVGFLALMTIFFKKDRSLFFWLAFFLIILSPTLLPLQVTWVVAERYAYAASMGIFVFTAWLLYQIGKIVKNQNFIYIIFAIILIALSGRTIARNTDWKDQDSLWIATARTSPSSYVNHNNLGDMYARHGEFEKAVSEFQKAIELKSNYGDAFHNLGNTYHQMGKDDLALENYQKALIFNPSLWQSYQNLAAIHFNQEEYNLAKEELEKAIGINPESAELHINLGIVFKKLGDTPKAKEHLQKALVIDPTNQKARQLLLLIDQ